MSNMPLKDSLHFNFILICIIECEFEYAIEFEIVPYIIWKCAIYNLHFFILLALFQWLYLPVLKIVI